MTGYRTVTDYREETEIRRSRFIAVVRRVKSEEEMFSALNSIRKEFSDATHVCYASVFDRMGNASRFSDDGEPSGTAGQPILEALKSSGLKEALVAVVRYFGGIKLGAGGLVRAYSSAASTALKNAEKLSVIPCDIYTLRTDFARAKRFSAAAVRRGINLMATEYSDCVTMTLAVTAGASPVSAISDILGEKPNLIKTGTQYIETPEAESV